MFVQVDYGIYININHVAKVEQTPRDDRGVKIFIFKGPTAETLGQLSVSDRDPAAQDLIASILNHGKRA